jgi:predicted transcriptional regulator
VSKTKVLGVRLDIEDLRKLEKIAESQGLKPSELARQIIVQYLDNNNVIGVDQELKTKLDALVENTKMKLEALVDKYVKHCEDYAREVAEKHPSENPLDLKRECLKRWRGSIMIDVRSIIQKSINELKQLNINDQLRSEYAKKLYQLQDLYQIY